MPKEVDGPLVEMPARIGPEMGSLVSGPDGQRNDADFEQHLDNVLAWPTRAQMHFQPIVDLHAGEIAGYEALSRFPREVGLPPNVWFERAGPLGRRDELQKLMVRKALRARSQLPQNCFLTVNVGPDFLVSKGWQEVLEEFPELSAVAVEITEETLIADYGKLRKLLLQIRTKGGLVAVDDAGAGYASLSHILEIKPDFIKIDRNFVQNCSFDRARSTMIEMVGAAASRLDAWIIAEGIETVPELEELIRLKVPLAQGYLLRRPAPEMQTLDSKLAQMIRLRQARSDGPTLEAHLCACPSVYTREAAEMAITADASLRGAVVVDVWQRPLELLYRHPLVGTRLLTTFMRAQMESDPAEVLDRALTREEALRFDPVVVIGVEGEALGIVNIDTLMRAALQPRMSGTRVSAS